MRTLEGIVIANKMQKTVIVEITRRIPHPLYKKLLKRSKKFKADTGEFSPKVGEYVKIVEVAPLSKDKHFKVAQIIQHGGKSL